MKNNGAVLLLFTILAFIAYGNSLQNDFVWDDKDLIADNLYIKDISQIQKMFTEDFFSNKGDIRKMGYYRPVINLSYSINYLMGGIEPAIYHFTNILFHLFTAFLLYLITLKLLHQKHIAFFAGFLFILHPVHTESVTWISGRTDVIAGFFCLLSLYLYLRTLESISEARSAYRCPLFYISLLCFVAALLSKEMALTLPIILFSYHFFFRYPDYRAGKKNFFISLTFPFWGTLFLYILIRFFVLNIGAAGTPPVAELNNPYFITLSFIKALFIYTWKLVYPANLTAYMQIPMTTSFFDTGFWGALLLLGILSYFILFYFKNKSLQFLWSSYLISFVPLSNFKRISGPPDMGFMMAERFLYFPSVFFCIISAWLFVKAVDFLTQNRHNQIGYSPNARKKKDKKQNGLTVHKYRYPAFIVFFLIFSTWYGYTTMERNKDWKNNTVFFFRMAEQASDAPLVLNYAGKHAAMRGDLKRAEDYFKKALKSNFMNANTHNNLATLYITRGQTRATLKELSIAEKLSPSMAETHHNRSVLFMKLKRPTDALKENQKALEINPFYTTVVAFRGVILAKLGRSEEAISAFKQAIKQDEDNPHPYFMLAFLSQDKNDFKEAEKWYRAGFEIKQDYSSAHYKLGLLYLSKNDVPRAIMEFKEELRFNPNYFKAAKELGNIYLKQNRYNDSLTYFYKAVRLNPSHRESYLNLAISLDQLGRRPEAAAKLKKALENDPSFTGAYDLLKEWGQK